MCLHSHWLLKESFANGLPPAWGYNHEDIFGTSTKQLKNSKHLQKRKTIKMKGRSMLGWKTIRLGIMIISGWILATKKGPKLGRSFSCALLCAFQAEKISRRQKSSSPNLGPLVSWTLAPNSIDCINCNFAQCRHDSVTEWLRWWTRNPLGSARRGSNPLAVALLPQTNRQLILPTCAFIPAHVPCDCCGQWNMKQ